MKTLYHYSTTKFESFDTSKCDGIWLTDISPEQTDLLEEIGANGINYVAICHADTENSVSNGSNYDVESQLANEDADCIENSYDGFTDYAFADSSKVQIIEWIEL